MTHLWIRAEERPNEKRVGVTPNGVKSLLQAGFDVTIERDSTRAISIESYSGAQVAGTGDWRSAPKEAIIIGLKELPEEITPLHHRQTGQPRHDFRGDGIHPAQRRKSSRG